MTYFRELPFIEYENFFDTTKGSKDFIRMKNIFVRGEVRLDLYNVFTAFKKYTIKDGMRPDNIAEELYSDSTLDWVVRIVANMVNQQAEYPLTSQQLWEFCVKKYGEDRMNNIFYHKTKEVRDSFGRLVLKGDLRVDKDFKIWDPDDVTRQINPTLGVTYFEHERLLNDDKREIYVLREEYLGQFLDDMESISRYGFSSQYIDDETVRTYNSKLLDP